MPNYTVDTKAYLEDGAAAHTATGIGQVGGANYSHFLGQGAVRPGTLVRIHVTALDLADTDETYRLQIVGTTDGYGATQVLAEIPVTRVGVWDLPFINQQAGVTYTECRIEPVLGGTTPSIQFHAYLTAPM